MKKLERVLGEAVSVVDDPAVKDDIHSIVAKAYVEITRKYPAVKGDRGFMDSMAALLDWVARK